MRPRRFACSNESPIRCAPGRSCSKVKNRHFESSTNSLVSLWVSACLGTNPLEMFVAGMRSTADRLSRTQERFPDLKSMMPLALSIDADTLRLKIGNRDQSLVGE